ncbi:MAG: Acetyl-CoA synthetase, partial [uncultured Solirubrobacteraceae bacterium]
ADVRRGGSGPRVAGPGAVQHRHRRVRQAPARQARDGVGTLRRREPRSVVRRAAGPVEPGGARPARARRRAGRARRRRAPADARDRRDLLRDVEARRDPAVDVGPLRRRRDPASPRRLRAARARHRPRERVALRGVGRRRARPRRRPPRRRLDRAGRRRHRRRRPGAALLHVGHDGPGEGDRPRAPVPARARGVHVLPRGAGRRALPRDGGVGLGRGHRPAARAVAPRRGAMRAAARGRVRPAQAARLPLAQRGHERLHDADRDAGDDGHSRRGDDVPAALPARLLGGRAAQPRGDQVVPRAVRPDRARLLRADRVLSAVRELPVASGEGGIHGPGHAGLGRPAARRGRAAGGSRRARGDLPARPLEPALAAGLLAQRGRFRGDVRRRVVPHEGRRDAGRGRLRLVRRARRRRDHRGRVPDRPVRGRVRVPRAPGRPRGRRGRLSRRAQGQRRQGVHLPRRGVRAVGRARGGDQDVRARAAVGLRVPAQDRVRRRPAQDADGQDPPDRAARARGAGRL